MSVIDANRSQLFLRQPNSEFRHIKGSKSQIRLADSRTQKAGDHSTKILAQNLTKINLKNRVLINTYMEQSQHKRTFSGDVQKVGGLKLQIRASMDLYEQFLKKLEKKEGVEQQVILLTEFLQEAANVCTFFTDVFLKVTEIVREYQKYVKSLDSTRIENQEIILDIKNSIFNKNPTKQIKYKPGLPKKLFNDSYQLNFSADSQFSRSDHAIFPKVPHKKLVLSEKRDLSLDKKQNASQKIPGLNLPKSENIGFHEEFMLKIDEFSESWRAEANKLKN